MRDVYSALRRGRRKCDLDGGIDGRVVDLYLENELGLGMELCCLLLNERGLSAYYIASRLSMTWLVSSKYEVWLSSDGGLDNCLVT